MSEAPDLTIELFELLTKIDNRLTVIEARTDRIENIETALGQLTRKVDTMKSDIIELKTKTTDLEKNADFKLTNMKNYVVKILLKITKLDSCRKMYWIYEMLKIIQQN